MAAGAGASIRPAGHRSSASTLWFVRSSLFSPALLFACLPLLAAGFPGLPAVLPAALLAILRIPELAAVLAALFTTLASFHHTVAHITYTKFVAPPYTVPGGPASPTGVLHPGEFPSL